MPSAKVSKQNWHTDQDRIANCRCRTGKPRGTQDAGGRFLSQIEQVARASQFARVLRVEASGTSGPSQSEILQKLAEFPQVNPWATTLIAKHRLVAVRPRGHAGAEDTPPAGPINGDKSSVSPPAAPVAHLHFTTPARSIPDPSPSQQPISTTNVATTQRPAAVTPHVRGPSTLCPEYTQENPPSSQERHRCG